MGSVGLGEIHLATVIALRACQAGYKVLDVGAIEAINDLITARNKGSSKLPFVNTLTQSLFSANKAFTSSSKKAEGSNFSKLIN